MGSFPASACEHCRSSGIPCKPSQPHYQIPGTQVRSVAKRIHRYIYFKIQVQKEWYQFCCTVGQQIQSKCQTKGKTSFIDSFDDGGSKAPARPLFEITHSLAQVRQYINVKDDRWKLFILVLNLWVSMCFECVVIVLTCSQCRALSR